MIDTADENLFRLKLEVQEIRAANQDANKEELQQQQQLQEQVDEQEQLHEQQQQQQQQQRRQQQRRKVQNLNFSG